jgi:hypothetical protein
MDNAGTITVTLPSASSNPGHELTIKTLLKAVSSLNNDVVLATGNVAQKFILTATAGKWATLVSDGTNWVIMAAN